MTHYHLYIETGCTVDSESNFFRVGCGTSKQSDRDYLFLLAHAANHGHYFKLWSSDVDDFLLKIRQSLDGNVRPVQLVSARQLVRAFKANSAVPLNQSSLTSANQQRMSLDLDYRILSIINRRSPGQNESAKGNTSKT